MPTGTLSGAPAAAPDTTGRKAPTGILGQPQIAQPTAPHAGPSPKLRRYARTSTTRIQKAERKAEILQEKVDFPIKPKEEKYHGLWWALDILDRPRNAFVNTLLHYYRGDRQGLQGVIESMKKGWTAEERAHYEDILADMSTTSQMALLAPLTTLGISLQTARKIAGFGGDILVDPLNLALFAGGAAKVAQSLKLAPEVVQALKIGSKADPVALGVRLTGKVAWGGLKHINLGEETAAQWLFKNVAQKTFWRTTGIKEIDNVLNMKVDAEQAIRSGAERDAHDLARLLTPLREKHQGVVMRLAEEHDIEKVLQFARNARGGVVTAAQVDRLLDPANQISRILNKRAVRQFIEETDPEKIALIEEGVRQSRKFFDKMKALREAAGIEVPELGTALNRRMERVNRQVWKLLSKIYDKNLHAVTEAVAELSGEAHGQRKALAEILGPQGVARLNKKIAELAPEGGLVRLSRRGEPDMAAVQGFMQDFLRELQPGMVAVLRSADESDTAARWLVENFERNVMTDFWDNPSVLRAFAVREEIVEAMKRVPSYVPHIATPEALARIATTSGNTQAFYAMLRTPKTSADIAREFAIKGRPLAFEEIEDIVRKGEYWRTAPSPIVAATKAGEIERPVLLRPEEGAGPLVKRKKFWEVLKTDKEIADWFQVDERQILASTVWREARSISAAEYLKEAVQVGGARSAAALKPGQIGRWRQLKDFDGGGAIMQLMPEIGELYVRPDIGQAIVHGAQNFMGDISKHAVVRMYDSMMDWWKSFTLPLFPAYHFRNRIGNLLNMNLAGFGEGRRDIWDGIQSSMLQIHNTRNNLEAMRGMKFHVKHLDQEIDGLEMVKQAMKHGVAHTGWHGAELSNDFVDALTPIWRNPKTYIPVSRRSLPVKAGRWVGQYIENGDRMTLFINRLHKGDSYQEAAATVKKFLGDYRTEIMTPFERNFMARIFPFYRWSRFNVPLQFEQLLLNTKNRAKILAGLRGQKLGQQLYPGAEPPFTAEELPPEIPTWIRDSAGVPVSRNPDTGELRFWIMEGWVPTADIDNWLSKRAIVRFYTNSSPFLLAKPTEIATGRSLYLDRQLEGTQSEFLGKVWDSEFVNWMRSLRVLSELDRLDPLGVFHRHERTLEPAGKRVREFLTGFKTYAVDPLTAKVRYDEARAAALNSNLARARSTIQRQMERDTTK